MEEAGDYSNKHELNQAKLQHYYRPHKLFLGPQGKIHIVHSIKDRKYKEMKLYSVLHRISSIWTCFGCCYHTQLPWYLNRFIKIIINDTQEMSETSETEDCFTCHLQTCLFEVKMLPLTTALTTSYTCGRRDKTLKLNLTLGRQHGSSRTGVGPRHRNESGLNFCENILK